MVREGMSPIARMVSRLEMPIAKAIGTFNKSNTTKLAHSTKIGLMPPLAPLV
jgi:hypothetical protein